MIILAGIGLWVLLGIGAGLLSLRGSPALSPGDRRLTLLWGVFGAVVGGFAGLIPSIPEGYAPWEIGSLVGATLVALPLSAVFRFRASRKRGTSLSSRRWFAVSLLGSSIAVAAFLSWFLLAVANPRLYNPGVNLDLDAVTMKNALRDPSGLRDHLEALVEVYLSRERNAGIVIGASLAGARVVVSGGVASKREGGPPVDGSSVFEIGSISKVFAGITLAQAVVANEVSLDQPIVSLLPDDGTWWTAESPPSVTLGELATHSSGLPEYPAAMPWWKALVSDNPYAELTRSGLARSVSEAAAALPEERSYRYSNFGFILLAHLLERAGDDPYPILLRQRLAEPLGMRRTEVPDANAVPEDLVVGHSLGLPVPHWIGHEFTGPAGVVSSADDLLTLAEAYFSIPPGPLGKALELAAADHGPAWGERRMGLGWHIIDERARPRILYHTGATLGFYAYVGVSPDAGAAVVVLANSSDPTAATIGSRMMEALFADRTPRTIDPRQMGGVPCIRALRIPVATIVDMVADGMSPSEVAAAYPDLDDADVREALQFAAAAVRERELPLAPGGMRFLVDNALSPELRCSGSPGTTRCTSAIAASSMPTMRQSSNWQPAKNAS